MKIFNFLIEADLEFDNEYDDRILIQCGGMLRIHLVYVE